MATEDDTLGANNYDLNQGQSAASCPVQTNTNINTKASAIRWKPPAGTVEETLTPEMLNEDLWLLVRQFNRQVSHVKAVSSIRVQELDLNRAAEEQFPPAKLQATIERFYTSVIIGLGTFFSHITKLRSWDEPRRTGAFSTIYLIAWLWDLLIPITTTIVAAVVFYPPIRSLLFHPSYSDTKDKATQESTPFACQTSESEEAEYEATNLANNITCAAIEGSNAQCDSIMGGDTLTDPFTPETLGPSNVAPPPGGETERPIKNTPTAINQAMCILSDITDYCERISNLISPSPPFNLVAARLRIVAILITMCLASMLLSNYVVVKAGTFLVGLGFFGDPILRRVINFLNHNIPNWKEYLDLEKVLLKGVPTNAQLTLTLFRIGEINSAPLSPPPSSNESKPLWPIRRKKSKMADTERTDGQSASCDSQQHQQQQQRKCDEVTAKATPTKRWLRVLKLVRRTITTAIKGHVAFNRAVAIAESAHAQGLLAMLDRSGWISPRLDPHMFEAKFERKHGTVVIDSLKKQPILYFTVNPPAKLGDVQLESQKKGSIVFQIPVAEIRELKKTEGLGWKGKLIVELVAGSKDSADGLVIQGMEPGQTYHVTSMRQRNQLFNRLVAMGAQSWEMH